MNYCRFCILTSQKHDRDFRLISSDKQFDYQWSFEMIPERKAPPYRTPTINEFCETRIEGSLVVTGEVHSNIKWPTQCL